MWLDLTNCITCNSDDSAINEADEQVRTPCLIATPTNRKKQGYILSNLRATNHMVISPVWGANSMSPCVSLFDGISEDISTTWDDEHSIQFFKKKSVEKKNTRPRCYNNVILKKYQKEGIDVISNIDHMYLENSDSSSSGNSLTNKAESLSCSTTAGTRLSWLDNIKSPTYDTPRYVVLPLVVPHNPYSSFANILEDPDYADTCSDDLTMVSDDVPSNKSLIYCSNDSEDDVYSNCSFSNSISELENYHFDTRSVYFQSMCDSNKSTFDQSTIGNKTCCCSSIVTILDESQVQKRMSTNRIILVASLCIAIAVVTAVVAIWGTKVFGK